MINYAVLVFLVFSLIFLGVLYIRFSRVDSDWIRTCEECSNFIKPKSEFQGSSPKAKIEGTYQGYSVSVSADLAGSFEGGALWTSTKISIDTSKSGAFQIGSNKQPSAKEFIDVRQEAFVQTFNVESTPPYLLRFVIESEPLRRRIMGAEFSKIQLEQGTLSIFVEGVRVQASQIRLLLGLLCDIDKTIIN